MEKMVADAGQKSKKKPRRKGDNTKALHKERLFVVRYCRNGRNGTAAAIYAGCAPKSAAVRATELLKRDDIIQAINAEHDLMIERTRVDGDRVIKELARVGLANIKDLVEIRFTGKGKDRRADMYLKDTLEGLSDDDTAAIAELTPTKEGIKVKLHGKIEALKLLGSTRRLELFKENHDHRFPDLSREQKLERVTHFLRIAAQRRQEQIGDKATA